MTIEHELLHVRPRVPAVPAMQFTGTPTSCELLAAWLGADHLGSPVELEGTHQLGYVFLIDGVGVRVHPSDWVVRVGKKFRRIVAEAFAEEFEIS